MTSNSGEITMKSRSVLLAVTFAMLVSSVCTSSSFARNSAPGGAGGAAGAAGSSSGGGSSGASSGSGSGGGNGGHTEELVILPPPHHKPVYQAPVADQIFRDARCALAPAEYDYFGSEPVMRTQICANQL
jgi:hypothetical protein